MSRVLKRETSKRDLIEQFVWYAESASIEVADRFLASAQDTLERLAAAPESGALIEVTREELAGMRRWPVKGFEKVLLFYIPLSDGIDLVRVLHGSRDLHRLFEDLQGG
jgi:toxin ParE1/3/4